MSMTEEELTNSLHRVGRIYWHRPDTADCLVTVTRLCSTQNERLCSPQQQHQLDRHQNPCLCNRTNQIVQRHRLSTAPLTPLLPTFSSNTSCASTLSQNGSSAPQSHGQKPPISTTKPIHPSNLGAKDLCSKSSNLNDGGVGGSSGLILQSAKRTISSRHRSNGSLSSLSTVSEDLTSSACEPKRTEAGNVASSNRSSLLVSGDIRRESAPSNMYSARTCCHIDDEQNQRSTTYRLHRDFLISQSQVFKALLQPDQGETASASLAATTSIKQDTLTTSVEIALPDPSSFAVLVEYFYMGEFDRLTSAMESGKVRWENVMLNASHLGLSTGLKRQLGGWWRGRKDGLHSVERGVYHRSSLPVLTSDRNGSGGGELGSWYGASSSQTGSGGGRCRAYTTGSRDQVEYKEREVAMTPSTALALASGLVRPATEEGISSGNKRIRTTEPDTESSHRHSLHYRAGSQQNANTARTVVQSPRSRSTSTSSHLHRTRKSMDASWPLESLKAPVEEQLQRDQGRSNDGRAVSWHGRAERPSAMRQLLLGGGGGGGGGGKRRRALSNLAYYCSSTRTQGSTISAPVKQ
ncbi:uncharacterized protein UTRI_03028 [Ustilago trichophora]|uniref:BTB domain-containing protein n=1 Tax=Ustilago trichophora TaxID=86804 RepID=A0A5C3E4M3_9BASI|nr:uncharacterized protein UTRI_03028 [Ustilago trichophora]